MIYLGISDFYESNGMASCCRKDHRPGDWLFSYARCFDALETHFASWQTRESGSLSMMAKDAPEGFRLAVTVHCGANRQICSDDLAGLSGLLQSIRLLQESNKLACLVARFSGTFRPDIESLSLLERLRCEFSGLPLAVEFGHDGWLQKQALDFLREMDMALVCVEDPRLLQGVPKSVAATSKLGYLRFHGPSNQGRLQARGKRSSDGYRYTVEGLKEWLPRIKMLRDQTQHLYIFMRNSCLQRALGDARKLQILMEDAGLRSEGQASSTQRPNRESRGSDGLSVFG